MRLIGILAAGAAVVLGLAGCSSGATKGGSDLGNGLRKATGSTPSGHGGIAVLAAENMWGDVLAQIGGAKVSVTSIISDPNADPHEYESSVTDAAAIAHARLVVTNGAGYDDFVNRLVSAGNSTQRVVLSVANIVGVHGSNPNPHLWYDPGYVTTAARAFERALADISPVDSATFSANLAAFLSGEQTVVGVIDQLRSRYAGTKVGYTERVAGYLVQAAALQLGTPSGFAQAVEDGNDPSPLDNATFEHAITAHVIKVLIYNSQVTDTATSHIRKLASSNGIPTVGMSETFPPADKDFQTWQLDQARALLAALGG